VSATEDWPGQWESEARLTHLASLERLARGWTRNRWQDPAARLRDLDDRYAGPAEDRSMSSATMSGADALAALDRLDELDRRSRDEELLDVYEQVTGCARVQHSRGWPS
jgi:hypothetical protein